MALLGAPYIYDISSLRVNTKFLRSKLAVKNECRNPKNSLPFAGQFLCIPVSLTLQCWPRCNVRSLNSSHLAGLGALKGTVDLKALWPGQYM